MIVPTCVSASRIAALFPDCDAKATYKAMREGYAASGDHWSHDVADYMVKVAGALGKVALGDVGDLYGETLADGTDGDGIFFVNVGDPYRPTLIFNYWQDRWFIGCWGGSALRIRGFVGVRSWAPIPRSHVCAGIGAGACTSARSSARSCARVSLCVRGGTDVWGNLEGARFLG